MNLLTAFMLVLVLQVSAAGYAQKVTLHMRNVPLMKVFKEVRKQTGFSFFYNSKMLKQIGPVTVQVNDADVSDVLEQCLRNHPVMYRIVNGMIILSEKPPVAGDAGNKPPGIEAALPDFEISGTVKDEKGVPLSAANVKLKGSDRGVSTDNNGQFRLLLPDAGGVLVISYIGYETLEVPVSRQVALSIVLKLKTALADEVVIVGYGSQSKRIVTGSIARVNMSTVQDLPNTNITQAVRGRVAGVIFTDNGRPGQNGTLLIRGPRSLLAGNNPLIVLDGIFFNGSLSDINPNDIETMDILKDASAAAIYGSRAANGVVLITSKKGNSAKPTIRANVYYGYSTMDHTLKLLSPERYIQKTLDYRAQTGLAADPAKIADYLTTTEAANYKDGKTVDPWKAASQQGRIGSYDLSVSGKTDATNYYLSASLADERGVLYKDNQKRVSLRSNIELQVNKWFTIGMAATYARRNMSGIEPALTSIYYSSPFGTWYYPDGEPTRYSVPEEQISGNPVRSSILTTNEDISDNLFANFYGILKVPYIKGLSYRINYSPNSRWSRVYNFTRQDKYVTTNTMSANKFNQRSFDWVLENIITYNKEINRDHGFDITLLYGRNYSYLESTTANAANLSSDAVGWNNLGLGAILTNTSTAQKVNGISSMARLNYRLMGKYLVTLTARQDGSSVFAKNNKYATFPSGAFSWIISDESFLKDIKVIDFLKLRASYGAVGNQAINPYQSLSVANTTQYVYGDGGTSSLGVFPATMANDDLKWETTYTGNVALDFTLMGGRIGGTIEAYNSNTKNLLISRSLPTMSGFTSVITNLGATNNKGLEITINTVNYKQKKFEWSSSLVFSTNKNKIVHLYRSDINKDGREDDDLANRWFIGRPITVYYDYVFDGIYQEGDQIPTGYKPGFVRLKDLNKDGKIDATNDRTIVGSGGQPKYRWGFTNTFRYNNITLSIFINGMQGWDSDFLLLDPNSTRSENSPGRALNQIDAGWWTAENKSTTRPSLVYTNPNQHNYYVSRNFVRIQDVSLTYDFSKAFLSKMKIANLRAFVSGKNLATFTDWPGTDPEGGQTLKSAIYPFARTITFGLNAGF